VNQQGKTGKTQRKTKENQGKPRNNPGKHQENTRENQDLLTQLNITYITEPSNEPIDHQHQSSKYERKAPSAGGGINQRNKPTKRRKNGQAMKLNVIKKKTSKCKPATVTGLNVKDIWKRTALMNQTVIFSTNKHGV